MGSDDPFILPPQSVLSVSGGRTSVYMLWRVLRANGGKLPPDVVPIFCNTGKEREETLRFVRECSERWGVPVRWLEYRHEPGRHYYEEVTFDTASRKGEPLLHAIRARGYLPNPVARICTVECKIRTSWRFAVRGLGWGKYLNAVGLRADEPERVAKLLAKPRTITVEPTLFGDVRRVRRNRNVSTGETPTCPLAAAGVTNADVLAFWAAQSFDLRLPVDPATGRTLGGNCDLCFLKGAASLVELIRERPESADWWVQAETMIRSGGREVTFRSDRPSYGELKRIALGMVDEPGWLWADRGGMACGGVEECNCTD